MMSKWGVQASGGRLGAGLAAGQVLAAGTGPGWDLIDSGPAVERAIDLGLTVGQQRQELGLVVADGLNLIDGQP